ncbi:hypothetical protein TcasGA2_TC033504 [Tribolium castaneum]|uniref:Reverse transcriptase domain-containing protein n=1 Tax=Tribolium castaneum TaxID=7070 RepID=A0A139W8L1_TRICA|nr:hypothetical protein TcasGA2_TC033504 [Tribolium castaneum]
MTYRYNIDEVTNTELEIIIKNLKKKAPGLDKIDGNLTKIMHPSLSNFLLHIYNSCLRASYFPKCWKMGNLVVIPKDSAVTLEPTIRHPVHGNLKPDLVVQNREGVYVVDVTVRHEDGNLLAQGRQDKLEKYEVLLPILQERLGAPSGEVLPIVVGTRGAMPKETVKALKKLRITDRQTLLTISLIALRMSVKIYHTFMDYANPRPRPGGGANYPHRVDDEESDEEMDEVEDIKTIKDDLRKILFCEANKCSKATIEQILNKFEDLERVTIRLIKDNSFLKGRIKEMKMNNTTGEEKRYQREKGMIKEQKQDWTIEEARRRDPTLMVYDVPEKMGNEELAKEVYKKNMAALMGEEEFIREFRVYGCDLRPYLDWMTGVKEKCADIPLLIGMDANAVSPLWHSKIHRQEGGEKEARGKRLEDHVAQEEFLVLNQPSQCYTFSGPMGESDIDVTICNREWMDKYETCWEVNEEWGCSDHNCIVMYVNGREARECMRKTKKKKWRMNGVDWEKFKDKLHAVRDTVLYNRETINGKVYLLETWIETAIQEATIKINVGSREVRWWTDELGCLQAAASKARKGWQRSRKRADNEATNVLLQEEFRRASALYKKRLKKNKFQQWQELVGSIGCSDPWGEVYKICKGGKGDRGLSVVRKGGVLTKSWKETVEVLLDEFFPDDSVDGNNEEEDEVCCVSGEERPKKIEEWEVNASIQRMNGKKSPGMDEVTPEMVKVIWMCLKEELIELYNECVRMEYFPVRCKKAREVLLLKGSDKDRTLPRSYRAICLLPVFGKVLETMVVERLQGKIENMSSNRQYGFKKGMGTEDAWMRVKNVVAGSEKKFVMGLFVGFKGAFDNLRWNVVLKRIKEAGCLEYGLWKSYFCDRKVCAEGEGREIWKQVWKGYPQGSICGPSVWNMMTDELLNDIENLNVEAVAYADDVLCLLEGLVERKLKQKEQKRVNPWIVSYTTTKEVVQRKRREIANNEVQNIIIAFKERMTENLRNHNLPTSRSDIAAVFEGDEPPFVVDLVIYEKNTGHRNELKNLNRLADPMDIMFDENDDVERIEELTRKASKLMTWFEVNRTNPEAQNYKYADIPEYYTWDNKNSKWNERRKMSKTIGTLAESWSYFVRGLEDG